MFTFNVGPSQLSGNVKQYIQQAVDENILSISHRSPEFTNISQQLHQNLRELLQIPADYKIFYLSSATECMEAALRNFVVNRSHHFINGAFSEKFYKMALEINKKPSCTTFDWGEATNYTPVEKDVELICLTHNASSTGVTLPQAEIKKFKENNPDKLIALDIVSSVGGVFPKLDNVDIAFFSVQKCFGLPSGFAIMIANDQAIQKSYQVREQTHDIGAVRSIPNMLKRYDLFQTDETPNLFGIYLLKEQSKYFLEKGAKAVELETLKKNYFIQEQVNKNPNFDFFVKENIIQSPTVSVIKTPWDYQEKIKAKLLEKEVIIGAGYGKLKKDTFRLANFPAVTLADFKKLFKIINQV